MKILGHLFWGAVAVLAALCLAGIAINRGEPVNSMWMVVGAASTYAVGYRFYAKFIAARVMFLNDKRATPAERLRDGLDFEPTNKCSHPCAAMENLSARWPARKLARWAASPRC